MKKLIDSDLNLNVLESWTINLHSFYNLISVLQDETQTLCGALGTSSYFSNIFTELSKLKESLSSKEHTYSSFKKIKSLKDYVLAEVHQAILSIDNTSLSQLIFIEESLLDFEILFKITEVKASEFLARIDKGCMWKHRSLDKLQEKLKVILYAMAKRSKDKYGVTFSNINRKPMDYCFELDLPKHKDTIYIPCEIFDMIVDLIANAKKYSSPRGIIYFTLSDSNKVLSISVKDYGKGIPADEIDEVVKFGVRGSNVDKIETYGGGFGLSKAYWITSKYNGTMWIDSVINEYTEIIINIPIPPVK